MQRSIKVTFLVAAVSISLITPPVLAYGESLEYKRRIPSFKTVKSPTVNVIARFTESSRYGRAILAIKLSSDYLHNEQFFFHLLSCQYFAGEFDDLIASCNQWLPVNESASNKTKALVYEYMGAASSNKGDFEAAVTAFTKAIDLDNTPEAYSGRAKAYKRLMKDQLAAEDEKHTLVIQKDFNVTKASPLTGLLDITMLQSGVPAAESYSIIPPSHLESAIREEKEIIKKACLLEVAGEFDKAKELYSKALSNNKNEPLLWNAYGLCLSTGRPLQPDPNSESSLLTEIQNAFKKAVELDDSNWKYWSNLAMYTDSKETKQSTTNFEKALQCKDIPPFQKYMINRQLSIFGTMQSLKDRYYKHLKE